jgi:hypothetical protein
MLVRVVQGFQDGERCLVSSVRSTIRLKVLDDLEDVSGVPCPECNRQSPPRLLADWVTIARINEGE